MNYKECKAIAERVAPYLENIYPWNGFMVGPDEEGNPLVTLVIQANRWNRFLYWIGIKSKPKVPKFVQGARVEVRVRSIARG
jgi:hypothetical protein